LGLDYLDLAEKSIFFQRSTTLFKKQRNYLTTAVSTTVVVESTKTFVESKVTPVVSVLVDFSLLLFEQAAKNKDTVITNNNFLIFIYFLVMFIYKK